MSCAPPKPFPPLAALVFGVLMWLPVTGCGEVADEPSSDAVRGSASRVTSTAQTTGLRSIDPPADVGAMAPELTVAEDGVHLTWLQPVEQLSQAAAADGPGHALWASAWDGDAWSTAQRVATADNVFANWADRPAMLGGSGKHRWAHWLRKLGDGTYAYGVHLLASHDGGATWQEAGLLHDDRSPTEHGFVTYSQAADGTLHVFWLDGRTMQDAGGSMQLRTASMQASGPTPSQLLDDRVCECCATDAAVTARGPIIAYRDRSLDEVRDIHVVRTTETGWSAPVRVHADGWKIQGCPVNGPAIDADGMRVAVAWFTAAEARPTVKVAFSTDGGARFGDPVVVDSEQPLGRVDLILHGDGAVVSWLSGGETAEIRWRQVGPHGALGTSRRVATTTAARSAGVPRMVRWQDQLIFTWIEDAAPSTLRAATAALP